MCGGFFMQDYLNMARRTLDFKGTSNLTECWVALIYDTLLGYAGMLLFALLKLRPLGLLVLLLMLLPVPALAVRRIRSAGRNPWNALWFFLPVGGILILACFMAQPDISDDN